MSEVPEWFKELRRKRIAGEITPEEFEEELRLAMQEAMFLSSVHRMLDQAESLLESQCTDA